MKDIYISGPMTGIENFNVEAFDKAEDLIFKLGHCPVNPADRARKWMSENGDRPMREDEYQAILKECLKDLCKCDAIMMLPGWRKSRGAKIEHDSARAGGKWILFYPE